MTVPAQRAPRAHRRAAARADVPARPLRGRLRDQPVDAGRRAVDPALAMRQWEGVRDAYLALGHRVDLLEPVAGLPDQVFAANGAVVVGGRGYGAKFRHPERTGEEQPFADTLARLGVRDLRRPEHVNEGEGDFLYLTDELLLAGHGFRTSLEAHAEAARGARRRGAVARAGRPALLPPRRRPHDARPTTPSRSTPRPSPPRAWPRCGRGSPPSSRSPRPTRSCSGLNGVSDGLHVVLEEEATGFAAQLRALGFVPVPVPTSRAAQVAAAR